MDVAGVGKRVRIYVGESDQHNGRPLFLSILELLRSEGCAGATVVRGLAGFGADSRIHTATILRLSEDLPIVLEWVDRPDRVERVLPRVAAMVQGGLITVEDVNVVHYSYRKVRDLGNRLRVREVMTRDVQTVHPDTPLREAVELLLNRSFRALPVVDADSRVVGIVTNGDLVERGGLRARLEVMGALSPEVLRAELHLLEQDRTVADVMSTDVTTTNPETTLATVAHTMVTGRFKRLPVTDASGRLLGMVSRVDLLRSLSEAFPVPSAEDSLPAGSTVGDVMRGDIPLLAPDASLSEVLDAVVSTRLNRAIVLDSERHLLGVVTDAELVRRLSPRDKPGVARALLNRLAVSSLSPEERRRLEQAVGSSARELMVGDIPSVPPETPIAEAIRLMLADNRKILPVVDDQGRFLGAVDRADLLRTLAPSPNP